MYKSQFELGYVALNVKNLELQTLYYQQVLGMVIINQSENTVDLGIDKTVLIRLITTEQRGKPTDSYGLYHLAIVLPSREDLGDIFKHFIDNNIPLIGASDHNYSEAIYLEDTEGNGIEIYRDRPMNEWDIREDGRIIGGTEPMDAEGVYALGKIAGAAYQMPLGSRMGHVHLSVRESATSSRFYQDLLQVQNKFSMSSAAWLASGDYHHHIAVNEWGGKQLQLRTEGMPGLAYYTVVYTDIQAYQATIKRAQAAGLNLHISTQKVAFVDVDGIKTQLILA